MWPWWRMKGEDGMYFVKCFAGFNDDPNNKKHLPIAVLESLDGYLTEAVPICDVGLHFDQVDTDEVEAVHAGFIADWRLNYVEEDK